MEPCCEPTTEHGRACPECAKPGRVVDLITVKAMLLPSALAVLADREFRFCATPGCPIVYFGAADFLRIEQIGVPVFQKEPPGARTVCYCFAINEADVDRELAASGRSTVVERISALVKAGRCACEVKNPQGSCCLGNVASVARSAATGSLDSTAAGLTTGKTTRE
jgi:Zinc binding domain